MPAGIAASGCILVGVVFLLYARRMQGATVDLAEKSPHLFPAGTAPSLHPLFVLVRRIGGVLFIVVGLLIIWFGIVN